MRWAETVAELRHEAVALASRGCLNILLRDGTPVGDCIGALEHYAQGVGQLAQQCSSLSDEAMTPAQVATLFCQQKEVFVIAVSTSRHCVTMHPSWMRC